MKPFRFKNSCDGIYSSLDIRFTKVCDNNCSFCIEKDGIDSLGQTNVQAMIDSTLKSGLKDILILGGEPFLQPKKLLEYVLGIRMFVDKIYITTSLPSTIAKCPTEVQQIISLIDGLNVSVQSTDWQENNKILVARAKHNRMDILKSLNQSFADKIRVSINLVKGGVDTKEKLLQTLQDLQSFGCKYVKINELQNVPNLYVNFEKMMGMKLASPYAFGCSAEITLPGIQLKLLLKRSCFMVERTLRANLYDLAKSLYKRYLYRGWGVFKVMYENGLLSNGWMKKRV